MAEFSIEKQPGRDYRPSGLRNVVQVPDSEVVISQTQPGPDEHQEDDANEDELDTEAKAVLERNKHKKPSIVTVPPLQIFGIEKPAAANIRDFKFADSKQATKNIPPQAPATALQPSFHPDTAILSFEHNDSGKPEQDPSISPEASAFFSSKEPITVKTSRQDQASATQHQPQGSSASRTASVSDLMSTEQTRSGFAKAVVVSQATSQATTPTATIMKKARSCKTRKKGKKVLLPRALVPWPPRHESAPDSLNPSTLTDIATNRTSIKPDAESSLLVHDLEDLAVKPHDGDFQMPIDRPNDVPCHRSSMTASSPSSNHLPISNQNAKQQHVNLTGTIQHELHHDRGRHWFVQKQQASESDAKTRESPPKAVSRPLYKTKVDWACPISPSSQQIPSITPTAISEEVPKSPHHPADTQLVLHGICNRIVPARVTKPLKKVRPTENVHPSVSATAGDWRSPLTAVALDRAIDSIRTAYAVDHEEAEKQMASAMEIMEQENVQLESAVQEQRTTIHELRGQLETSKKSLEQLKGETKTAQRYAIGLQKDYETCRKSVATLFEKHKQTLQDQLDDFMRTKADLGVEVSTAKESFDVDRSKLKKVIDELHIQLRISSASKDNLEKQLIEQARLYEEEKVRRNELEKHLLPSVQLVQRQLSDGSVVLNNRLNIIEKSLGSYASKKRNENAMEGCLQVLRKLDSMPLLTTHHVQKAEGMLRFVQERVDAGFGLVAKQYKGDSSSPEDIRQCIGVQNQAWKAEVSRHSQAIEDSRLAPDTNESLLKVLRTQEQIYQQLQQHFDPLKQPESTLKLSVAYLEQEKEKLQTAARKHESQLRNSELEVTKLRHEQSRAKDDLHVAHDTIIQNERIRLEQERGYCEYRSSARARLTGFQDHSQQMASQLQTNECERKALLKELSETKIEVNSVQTKYNELVTESSQHHLTNKKLCQERDRLTEQYDASQVSLRAAETKVQVLEEDKSDLNVSLTQARTSLQVSKADGTKLSAQCTSLQQELGDFRNAEDATKVRLQQEQHEVSTMLHQAEQQHIVEIEDMRSRLNLSENHRKETEAKVRQMEAAHKHQLKCLEQKANDRFKQLALESQQEQGKLKAQQGQEVERLRQIAKIRVQELEQRIEQLRLSTIKTLVPNSQPYLSQDSSPSASQLSQTSKTRKKVDRQTNSVTVVAPAGIRRVDTDEYLPNPDVSKSRRNCREGSDQQTGYFEEEYRNRFGTQVSLPEHETNQSLQEPDTDVVPETQDFEAAQGCTTQFEVIESQLPVIGDSNQEEIQSDLSVMASEDLSEMLLDARSEPGQARTDSRHLSSPKDTVQRNGQPGQEVTSDASSPNLQGRPKSRANTASRMMPLPIYNTQHDSIQAAGGSNHLLHTHHDQGPRSDNNNAPGSPHLKNTPPKPTHTRRSFVYENTGMRDADPVQKRKSVDEAVYGGPFKKLRTSAQSSVREPSSTGKTYPSSTPMPTSMASRADANPSPSSATGRRSSNRQSSIARSQAGTPLLSSTRNTRSKATRFADRFGQELDGY